MKERLWKNECEKMFVKDRLWNKDCEGKIVKWRVWTKDRLWKKDSERKFVKGRLKDIESRCLKKEACRGMGSHFCWAKKTGYGPTNGLTDRRIDHQTNRRTDGWMYPLNKKYFKGVENYFLPFSPILAIKKQHKKQVSNRWAYNTMDGQMDWWMDRQTHLYRKALCSAQFLHIVTDFCNEMKYF